MKFAWPCGLLASLAIVLAADCGAMTLEPLPPEEPLLPEAAPPLPRLVRPDGGPSQGSPTNPEE
jgi:hypothetical protein